MMGQSRNIFHDLPQSRSSTKPSPLWRFNSSWIMGLTGSISRGFLFGLQNMEVIGLDKFLETLDRRKNVQGRERGLITVSNHVSVLDDPLMWGVLPFRYSFNPSNHRWSLGSYDICFANRYLTTFFNYGQVLPTHRGAYSPIHGGLFQPTMTHAIRLLSSQPFSKRNSESSMSAYAPTCSSADSDPFTTGGFTYSTNTVDSFPSPSYYNSRKHSWIHIFPEGRVHQHPSKTLRYFKWGISRLILESEPCPQIVPIFIDGNQKIMHEDREFPRFVPRVGKNIKIAFGDSVDSEELFGELRQRWQELVRREKEEGGERGVLMSEVLRTGKEAVEIRAEVTRRIRNEVLKVRRSLGYDEEDPKQGLAETWIEEGDKQTGKMNDGSWVGTT